MVKDFNVKITVRNNHMIKRIEEQYGTNAEMSRQTGISATVLSAYATFKSSPINSDGGWLDTAVNIATALKALPSELWPEHLQEVRRKTATATLELSMDEVQQIASTGFSQLDMESVSDYLISSLDPRKQAVIRMRFIDGLSLAEVGEELKITPSRVGQLEAKAMQRMKYLAMKNRVKRISQVVDVE